MYQDEGKDETKRRTSTAAASHATMVSITPDACDEALGYNNMSPGLRSPSLKSAIHPYPGFLLLRLCFGCDQLLDILGHIQLTLGPSTPPNLLSARQLENLTSQPEDSALPETDRITFVCLFVHVLELQAAFVQGIGTWFLFIGAACTIAGAAVSILLCAVPSIQFLQQVGFGRRSVVRLQIGLMNRTDTRNLVYIKQLLDTLGQCRSRSAESSSSPDYLHKVLTDVVVALLRLSGCYVAADCSFYTHTFADNVQERFLYYNLEERGIRDEILLPDKEGGSEASAGYSLSSHLVVTLVVLAKWNRELPPMNDAGDVVENLKKLGCIPTHAIQRLEVYCTPFSDYLNMAVNLITSTWLSSTRTSSITC